MQTKLTLRIDENLIEFGKRWAKTRGKSLSQLVADYLAFLTMLPRCDEELPPKHQYAESFAAQHHYAVPELVVLRAPDLIRLPFMAGQDGGRELIKNGDRITFPFDITRDRASKVKG